MKNKLLNAFLILMLLAALSLIVYSIYTSKPRLDYTERTIREFDKMSSPVILVGKSSFLGFYSVILVDSSGKYHCFKDGSYLANGIGENYEVLDTIK